MTQRNDRSCEPAAGSSKASACLFGLAFLLMMTARCFAEDGRAGWLRYAPVEDAERRERCRNWARAIVFEAPITPILRSAAAELSTGLNGMLDSSLGVPSDRAAGSGDGAIVLRVEPADGVAADRFTIRSEASTRRTFIVGGSDRGVLYGAFALLRRVQSGQSIDGPDQHETPTFSMRMANTWDNVDGSIERGYGGRSLFKWDRPLPDPRHRDYARLLASIGIRALAINNVNADPVYLTKPYLEKVAIIAESFRPYGIQLFLNVSFDSPRRPGGLETADPLNPAVRDWWAAATAEAYRHVPDLGGFLIKADSEGQPGPYAYGRDHADGANMLAQALDPYEGTLIWRAFVYQAGGDRLKMAYETFAPLDGRFADNVVVQVKHGPLDFQVREPVHPLFGAMPRTNLMLEIQSAQEYTGQNVHLCFLAPMWRDVLEFDTRRGGDASIASILASRPRQGIAAVLNLGDESTWAGHHLAMANAYAAGRLAWDPTLDPTRLAAEWTRLTFGNDPAVVETITAMLAGSHAIYESYTSPLGLGMMHDLSHFDPAPQIRHDYHRAGADGIGYDRSVASGSGFVGQYAPPVAAMFEQVETTPESLLLAFHHLPYSHRMNDGRTLIQTLYDSYFDGAHRAAELGERWGTLAEKIDPARHAAVARSLALQAMHAAKWRDVCCVFLRQVSGVADQQGRVNSQYRLTR